MEEVVARGIQVLIALSGAYLFALWVVLAIWAYRDIESRSKSVVTQVFSTLMVVLFFIPGVLLYMMLRPRETLDSTFQRSLEEEYLLQDLEEIPLCPSCQHYIHDDFVVCPNCRTELREACPACSRLVDLRWNICPYCAAPQSRVTALPKVERPDERWVEPAQPAVTVDAPVVPEIAAAVTIPAAATVSTPAAEIEPVDRPAEEDEEPAPAVLPVYHHGQQVATVRPFDRRRTKASGRRSNATRDALACTDVEDADTDDELPAKYAMGGDGD